MNMNNDNNIQSMAIAKFNQTAKDIFWWIKHRLKIKLKFPNFKIIHQNIQ